MTIRIRIGQREGTAPRIGPLSFEFGSPAIVRTLLKNLTVLDAGQRVASSKGFVAASMVAQFAEFLSSSSRALPVVVLSGEPSTGLPIIDADDLARQVAGLAHVRVLTAGFASRKLTETVGPERSVWWGAARIYWPGFTPSCNPYDHKLWHPARLQDLGKPRLVEELRRWLGSLGSARTQPHPSIKAATTILGDRAAELPEWVTEYVESVEHDNRALERERAAMQTALVEAEDRVISLQDERDRLKRSIHQIGWAVDGQATLTVEVPVQAEPKTVGEAVTWALEQASIDGKCLFLESARKSGLAFSSYRNPAKLHRAIGEVAEASARFGDDTLGTSIGQWFKERGYGYRHGDDTRTPTFRIYYDNRTEYMEAHLKVDEATHPDQCLRIYWHIDYDERIFVVGHIGSHL